MFNNVEHFDIIIQCYKFGILHSPLHLFAYTPFYKDTIKVHSKIELTTRISVKKFQTNKRFNWTQNDVFTNEKKAKKY